jgi:hypothetical protein
MMMMKKKDTKGRNELCVIRLLSQHILGLLRGVKP